MRSSPAPAFRSCARRLRSYWTRVPIWRTSRRDLVSITLPGLSMISGVPLGELLWLAAAIIAGGVVTGILAGLFGIGGGAVIVPVLYEVFRLLNVPEEVRMQLCVGTSIAIIVPTA